MTSLKPLKISNPIYYGYLSLFVFLFMVSCDNEPAEGQHIPQLKKVSLNAREISEDIKNFIESGKATVVLTITTDKEGKVPAADYTALTTEDKTAKSLKKVTFPIEKDGSIDAFFLKASESGNTYYIQKFDFYKSGVSSSKPDYVLAEVKPFTLKIEGDNQVTLPITLNEVKTKGSTRLSSLKVAFKTMQYAYFTKDNDIDLTIRYIKSDKKYTVIDQQNVFNCKKVTIEEGKWLTIRLNDDEDFYKDGTFEVEAKVNDYPSALAVHDFIIPTEVDKQIRSGKLVLKMNNHLPSTTAAKNILTIDNFLTVTGVYDVKEEGGITTQDSDKDKLLIQYRYVILYRYKNPRAPDSTEPFDAVIPGTLSERCSDCVQGGIEGNEYINITSLRTFLNNTMRKKYYPYPSPAWLLDHDPPPWLPSIFRRPAWYASHPFLPVPPIAGWVDLRASDFALRLSVETNDGLQWTASKELLNIYFK